MVIKRIGKRARCFQEGVARLPALRDFLVSGFPALYGLG